MSVEEKKKGLHQQKAHEHHQGADKKEFHQKKDHDRRHGRHHGEPGKQHERKHSQWGDVWYRFRRNKLAVIGMVLAIFLVLISVLAPVLTPYDEATQDVKNRFMWPCLQHLMGTDNFGRDLFTRVLYGGRTSLVVAFLALIFSVIVAIVLGAVAGYYGGWLETIIMRGTDVVQSVPPMLFAVVVSAALGGGIWQTAVAVGISGVAPNVRLLRGQILSIRSQEYVRAAVATGSSGAAIMFKEILPNVLSPLIVSASMGIGGNITAISGLSFIGLGVKPPVSEWGNIMTGGLDYIMQFWPMAVFPGIMIMLTLFAFNCAGDGLRDALDPKLKQ